MAALLDLPERGSAQRKPVEFGIVAKNGLVIAGAADVKLKTVNAMLQGEIKSGKRVFRCVPPRAAVP